MKNQERNDRTIKYPDESSPKDQFSSTNQNNSSELEFIVPWVQISKHGLERHKNLLENERI